MTGHVIETGRIKTHGPSDELVDDESIRPAYLGI